MAGALSLLVGASTLLYASRVTFLRSTVLNISGASLFGEESFPGFVWQSPAAKDLETFRMTLPSGLRREAPSLKQAVALCHWVRMQQPDGKSWRPVESTISERVHGDSEDPLVLLAAQRSGFPANCRRFAYLLVGAAASVGMKARVVIVDESFFKIPWSFKGHYLSHEMAEVWIPELNKWVLMDAMWDEFYLLKGHPASTIEIYDAVQRGEAGRLTLMHAGRATPVANRETLRREFGNVYISLTNALFDGYRVCFRCDKEIEFAHLTGPHSEPYPVWSKRLALILGASNTIAGLAIVLSILARTLWFAVQSNLETEVCNDKYRAAAMARMAIDEKAM